MIAIHKRVEALEGALREIEGLPFGYAAGECDCVRFPARVVVNATGRDPLEGLSWGSLETAILAVESDAGTLSATLDKRFERIAPSRAIVGDLVAIAAEPISPAFDVALGVFDGDRALFWLDGGLRRAPRSRIAIAWRVG